MAHEKLLVCDALDERDFLRKKIMNAIKESSFIGAKREREDNVNGVSVSKFEENAKATYQSIKDMIKRYNAIDVAITQSNASTEIETRSGVKMTRAAAIAQRKIFTGNSASDSDFTGALLRTMKMQYQHAVMRQSELDSEANKQAELLKVNFIGKDSTKKITEDDIKTIETMVAPIYGNLVDPLNLKEEYDKMLDSYNSLIKELETAIKVSNATTYIEIDY